MNPLLLIPLFLPPGSDAKQGSRSGALILALLLTIAGSGCLQTRGGVKEQDEKQVLRKQVADTSSRFGDLDEEMRRLNGRLEVLEQKLAQQAVKNDRSDQGLDGRVKASDERQAVIRDEVLKLSAALEQLSGQVAAQQQALQALVSSPPAKRDERASAGGASLFDQAEALFERKSFQDAILKYEDFRKANPRNRRVAEATYKIGLAFEELKSTDEAKAFYEEVVQRFPKTREAEKAQARLRRLKKR